MAALLIQPLSASGFMRVFKNLFEDFVFIAGQPTRSFFFVSNCWLVLSYFFDGTFELAIVFC
jgi:hypothetical protein